MKNQLKGIAAILLAILLTISYGDRWFFGRNFDWSLIFCLIGVAGAVMVFLPSKGE